MLAKPLGVKVVSHVNDLKFQKTALKTLLESVSAPNVNFEIKPISPLKTIVSPGETFVAELPVRNPSSRKFADNIVFTLRDFWMHDCGSKSVDLQLQPGEAKTLKVAFTPKLKGIYKIEAKYKVNGAEKISDLSSFASYPPPTKTKP